MPVQQKMGGVLNNRYRIDQIIGQGGYGCIYLAEDLRLAGRKCAVKEVQHDPTLSAELFKETRDQFLREATVLARLDHPNLPKVSDYFSIKDADYLVMDYVPGEDLRTLMLKACHNNKFLPESEVIGWANQLADALIYMHNQEPPVLHRDIKPSNLKLTPNGIIKLVDFGLVKLLAPGEVTITILQGQGTAIYTPLEQYGGDSGHTDVRSDIYAFGATLYHLLTNQAPVNVRDRFLSPESFISPREINSSISPRTARAIQWAMAMHPDERPKDVYTFMKALGDEIGAFNQTVGKKKVTGGRIQKPEKTLLTIAGVLSVLGFILTLINNI